MGFLNPWMLLGMAGVAAPLIIHLLNRFRRREVDWAAMELLRSAMVERSRQVQLEDLLLLILRCLAVLLIAFAMSRPTLPVGGSFMGGADVGVVVAIDASYSTAHRSGVEDRFSRAIRQTQDILRTVTPGTPVTVVLMGDRPQTLYRNMGYEEHRLNKILQEARPLPERLNLDRSLEQVSALVDELKAPQKECYLVSDSQGLTWGRPSDSARRWMQDLGQKSRLYYVGIGAEGSENVALTRLEMVSGSTRRGRIGRYVAEVQNTGRQPQTAVEVTLLLNDRPVDRRVIETLGAGERRSVPLFARFESAGAMRIVAKLGPDSLTTDNERYAAAAVREQVRVLLVDGGGLLGGRLGQNSTDFLARALQPKSGDVSNSLKVETVSWTEVSASRLAEYDVVVLVNLADIRHELAGALRQFVTQGGGLVVFPGDKLSEPGLLNAKLADKDAPLLPARFTERTRRKAPGGRAASSWSLAPMAEHRLSNLMLLMPAQLLGEARVEQLYKVEPLDGAVGLIKTAEDDLPILLEKTVGRGKVLQFTTSADRTWANLAIHPLFPMLVNEAVAWMTTPNEGSSFQVGEPLVIATPANTTAVSVNLRNPQGKIDVLSLQTPDANGRRVARFEEPTSPGFYEADLGMGESKLLAVNVDSAESEIAPLAGEALAEALATLPITLLNGGGDLAQRIREHRIGKELWRYLLLLALAVLAAEQWLAHRFGRRLSAQQSPSAAASLLGRRWGGQSAA